MLLRPVPASEFEKMLADLRKSVAVPDEGFFGPASISWQINRESALFLAAGRAAILQLAHPWVGAAIAQHSRTLDDPIARFHHTFRVIFTMVFGPADHATAAARQLHRLHQTITGTLPDAAGCFKQGTAYEANEVSALRWVYATLVDSALTAYELLLPRLSDAEKQQYFSESLKMAALFGIAREHLPQSWPEFRTYFETTIESDLLGVSSATQALAQRLQSGAGLVVPPPFWYRALTIQLLPPCIREHFQLPYRERERRAAMRALACLRPLYTTLPAVVRFVGPYNEARNRLRSRRPGLAVRLSNRLWVGEPALFAATGRLLRGDQASSASRAHVAES
jgi:uncharacterized protein (DUF2236 family)